MIASCLIASSALFKFTILFQAAGYKEDFEQERKDREILHAELTSQLIKSQGVAHGLQQKLIQSIHVKEHETQTLKIAQQKEIEVLQNQLSKIQEHKSTQEVTSKLTEEKDKIKDLEEKNLVLISRVNAYSRQCEKLIKTMIQLQEKSKTLEEEAYHKERIASEVM